MRMNDLKSQLIFVNCMNFATDSEGSNNMYEENRSATTIVTTNGTVLWLAGSERERGAFQKRTIVCH